MSAHVRLSHADYAALADFRHKLRSFLHFSSEAAQKAGLSPSQHQALLALKAAPADEPLTIGQLAERLQVRHHSAVGLIDRLTKRRLVKRKTDDGDRRKVHLLLTTQGEALISNLSSAHKAELKVIGPAIRDLLETIADDA